MNAYGSDNLFGAGRVEENTSAGKIGAAFGDIVATIQGTIEAVDGTGLTGGGLAASATGGGAVLGVPATATGGAMMLHGGSTALIGGAHLLKAASSTDSTSKESEGPKAKDAAGVSSSGQATDEHGNKLGGSGKPQVHNVGSGTREAGRNKALNKGSGAVEHGDHWHPADAKGNKKPSSAHFKFPKS